MLVKSRKAKKKKFKKVKILSNPPQAVQKPTPVSITEEDKIEMYKESLNDLESVKILITYGANVNAKNLEYNTPLDIAIIEENQSINDFLIGLNAQASYGSSYQLYLSSQ